MLVPLLRSGDFLALYGSLGAGKTTFVRCLLQTLGVGGEIPSPTFTLVQNYSTPEFSIAHYDLYRLKHEDELEELGWFEAHAEQLMLVEWPERAEKFLPPNRLELHFEITGEVRELTLLPRGTWVQRLADSTV